jgi:hypothetical protein
LLAFFGLMMNIHQIQKQISWIGGCFWVLWTGGGTGQSASRTNRVANWLQGPSAGLVFVHDNAAARCSFLERGGVMVRFDRFSWVTVLFALVLILPTLATAQTRGNPLCPNEDVFFDPGHGQNIVVPPGFQVSVFAQGLNFPTAVAFRGDGRSFEVFVLESGHGLPSRCNDETSSVVGGEFSATNPFTPDILVFNESGRLIRGPLAKPTGSGGHQSGGLQAHGPAIDIAFEKGFEGGRLFATDSNQAIRAPATNAQNNSSVTTTATARTSKTSRVRTLR